MGALLMLLLVFTGCSAPATYPLSAAEVCESVCFKHDGVRSIHRPVSGVYLCTCKDNYQVDYL